MDGTLGHFWTDLSDVYQLDKSRDGYVRLSDDSLFHVDTLRTRDFHTEIRTNRDRLPRPAAVYAMTASTRSIFFDVAGISRTNVMGQAASTQTIRTRGIVVDVPFAVLENSEFLEVELWVPEVTLWSGLEGISERVEHYEDNTPKKFTASTVGDQTLEIDIRQGLRLTLDTTWAVEGPEDKRVLNTPAARGLAPAQTRCLQSPSPPALLTASPCTRRTASAARKPDSAPLHSRRRRRPAQRSAGGGAGYGARRCRLKSPPRQPG
jgi:hypothetical protein